MSKTKAVVAALAVACAMAVTACGGSSSSGSSSGGSANGPVKGQISLLVPEYSTNTAGFWRDLINRFQTAHPGAKVKLQTISWTDINQKVTTLVSTRQAPDILNLDAYANFAADKLLLPANDVLSPKTRADFLTKFADNGKYQGTQYGIPFVGSVRALFYNKDIFKKAGIQRPPKTWDELRADAKKITSATGETGYGMPLGPEEAQAEFSLFMWGNGGDWLSGDKWTIDKPQNVQALQFMNQLAQDKVTQPNPGTTNRTDLWKVFGAGKIGMVMGSNFYPVLLKQQNPKLHYGVAPIPVNGSNPPVTLGVEDYLMAFNSTKHKPVVKAFLDFLFQQANYGRFIRTEGFLPVTKSVSAQVVARDPKQKLFFDQVANARFYPTTNPTWGAIAPQVKERLGSAVQGKSPASVLGSLQKEAEKGS
jgi:multiple sugar transport system substrate-binding protein